MLHPKNHHLDDSMSTNLKTNQLRATEGDAVADDGTWSAQTPADNILISVPDPFASLNAVSASHV